MTWALYAYITVLGLAVLMLAVALYNLPEAWREAKRWYEDDGL